MIIKDKVDNYFNEIIDIRRTLHQNPELSEHEVQTSKFICELLSKWRIEYESNVGGNDSKRRLY